MKPRRWRIAGINFDHFHMGDLLRYAVEHPRAEVVGICDERSERMQEAIRKLPRHAVLLASSPACPVQGFRIGRNVYATQFHPELDVAGLCLRIEVYRYSGSFEPDEAESLQQMARASAVLDPPRLLLRFIELYARA